MFPSSLLVGFLKGYSEAMLRAKQNNNYSFDYAGMRIDLTKWTCSYCDSINTTENNCKNCGAPESRGRRNFQGLPFRKTTFLYPAK